MNAPGSFDKILAGNAPQMAARLIANGYRPVPCNGKAVLIKGWTERDFTAADFTPGQNIGIKTGQGVVLLDIDVTDREVAEAIAAEWKRRHPEAAGMRRTGKAPKTAFLFASDVTAKRQVALRDAKQKVEVLAAGQQFIAYGVHPETGAPYHWHGGLDPLDSFLGTADMLARVSEAEVGDFLGWVARHHGPKAHKPNLSEPAARFRFEPSSGSGGFFRAVNDAALQALDLWVPALLPAAVKQATGAWRVTSRDLGRDFEEDLSIHPAGVRDFGPEAARTAIDLVMEFGGAPDATAAAKWICEKIGRSPESFGWADRKRTQAATSDGAPRPNVPDDMDLSHDALALGLGAESFDRDARHVASWGKWLFWTGTRWETDDRLDHLTRTRAYLRDRADALVAWAERKAAEDAQKGDKLGIWAKEQARTLRSKITVAAVESLARSNPASVARSDAFDADRLLLGTPGGTVDLRTGLLRPAERGDMITKLTACAPAGQGTRPERWLAFLHEIFGGDRDLVAFMQRAAGYALTGLTSEHKLLFLYGTGRNGKSVFLNTLTHIWGDYARRAAAEVFLNSHGEKHSTGIAGLQGARLVAGSELPKGRTWDESVIKDLTGGDRMSARYMRQDFFDFDPQLTLIIAGNNQPSFRGVDEAIRARVVLVPFLVTIPPERRDKSLPDKLKAEGPAILRWAIDGALDWQSRGLDVPAKVAAASEEYMDDEDTLAQFLADETVTDPLAFTTTSDLHARFGFWCERQGLGAWTLRTLQKEMKSRQWQECRRNFGRGFLGVRLK